MRSTRWSTTPTSSPTSAGSRSSSTRCRASACRSSSCARSTSRRRCASGRSLPSADSGEPREASCLPGAPHLAATRLIGVRRVAGQIVADARIRIGADVAAAGVVDVEARVERAPRHKAVGLERRTLVAVGLVRPDRIAIGLIAGPVTQVWTVWLLGERGRRNERRKPDRGNEQFHGGPPLPVESTTLLPCRVPPASDTGPPIWLRCDCLRCATFDECGGAELTTISADRYAQFTPPPHLRVREQKHGPGREPGAIRITAPQSPWVGSRASWSRTLGSGSAPT